MAGYNSSYQSAMAQGGGIQGLELRQQLAQQQAQYGIQMQQLQMQQAQAQQQARAQQQQQQYQTFLMQQAQQKAQQDQMGQQAWYTLATQPGGPPPINSSQPPITGAPPQQQQAGPQGLPPAPAQGQPMQPAAQAAMAQIMSPQQLQPSSAMAPQPMPTQQPPSSMSAGGPFDDPQWGQILQRAQTAKLSPPMISQLAQNWIEEWKDKQGAQSKSLMDTIREATLNNKQTSLDMQKQNMMGPWSSAPEGAESNPQDLPPDKFLSSLPADLQGQVKGLADGSQPWPTGYALRSPGIQKTLAAVYAYDPDASATRYGVMQDFTKGQSSKSIQAFNAATQHLEMVDDLAKALKNGDVQAVNALGNSLASATGDPAPTNFDAAKQIVSNEVLKAVAGGIGALSDREEIQTALSKANSPEQLSGVIDTFRKLMGGQLKALENKYKVGTGQDDFKTRFLLPSAQADFSGQSSGAGGEGTVITNPQTGQTMVLKGGQWTAQ